MMNNKNILVVIVIALLFTGCGKDSTVEKTEEIYTKNLLSLNDEDGRKLDPEKTYILRLVKAFDTKSYKKSKPKIRPKMEIIAETKIDPKRGYRIIHINKILNLNIVNSKKNSNLNYIGKCKLLPGTRNVGLYVEAKMIFFEGEYPTELVDVKTLKENNSAFEFEFDFERDKYDKPEILYSWDFADGLEMDEVDYIQILNY